MMSGAAIADLSARAARKAAREHKHPLLVEAEDMPNLAEHIRHLPNLGDYRPPRWELVDTYFVDTSGFGQPGEPALTLTQFLKHVKVGFGYGLIEAGQFQVYVGEFAPRTRRGRHQNDRV